MILILKFVSYDVIYIKSRDKEYSSGLAWSYSTASVYKEVWTFWRATITMAKGKFEINIAPEENVKIVINPVGKSLEPV